MRVILDVEDAKDLSLALSAFTHAAQDKDCRDALKRKRGLVGIRFADRYWSVSSGKTSFTVREAN